MAFSTKRLQASTTADKASPGNSGYLRHEMAERIYLLLGSNEGDRENYLRDARESLRNALDGNAVQASGIYETAAWGLEDQPAFLNQALSMITELSPEDVLNCIREVEAAAERQRTVRWGQRTLDVDILIFGDMVIDTPELRIPHPELGNRRFALLPLAEIAADLEHPVLHQSIAGLLAVCPDPLPAALLQNR